MLWLFSSKFVKIFCGFFASLCRPAGVQQTMFSCIFLIPSSLVYQFTLPLLTFCSTSLHHLSFFPLDFSISMSIMSGGETKL